MSAAPRHEPAVIGPQGPHRSSQRPTGSAVSAATARPTVKAPVIAMREAPRSASIDARNTGKP